MVEELTTEELRELPVILVPFMADKKAPRENAKLRKLGAETVEQS